MTKQEILDTIRANAEQLAEPGACRYINDEGQRCVVGLLLTQEEIDAIKNCTIDPALDFNEQPVRKLVKVGLFPERLRPWAEWLDNLQYNFDNHFPEQREAFLANLERCWDNADAGPDEYVPD